MNDPQDADPISPPADASGKPPRRANDLRGRLGDLASANRQRHQHVDHDCREARIVLDAERRRQRLFVRLGRVTLFGGQGEFDTFAGLGAATSPIGSTAKHDFTADELFEYLLSKLQMDCTQCGYYLRGLPRKGACPECGADYRTGAIKWEELCDVLAEELDIPPQQIERSTPVLESLWQAAVASELRAAEPVDLSDDASGSETRT